MRYFFIVGLVLLMCLTPSQLIAKTASAGAFTGYYHSAPQSELPDGITFGVKGRLHLTWTFFIEPYFLYIHETDKENQADNPTVQPNNLTISSLGTNLIIGTSLDNFVRPYALMGIGLFDVTTNTYGNKSQRFGSNWGIGMEINLVRHQLFFDVNTTLQFINHERNTAMIGTIVNGGLNWYFNIDK